MDSDLTPTTNSRESDQKRSEANTRSTLLAAIILPSTASWPTAGRHPSKIANGAKTIRRRSRPGFEREDSWRCHRKMARIQVNYRRFGFAFGKTFAAVKDYRSERSPAPTASFGVTLKARRDDREILKLSGAEILKRIPR